MARMIDGLLERLGIRKGSSMGIAFSGGGARGFAHLGVLKAFEHFGMRPDVMSGVSAGSIVVALYGAGLSIEDIMKCFAEASGLNEFTEWAIPKRGFMKLDRFAKLLDSWLPVKYLEDLKIPSVVCATDFDNAKSVGWIKGEIVPRVIASCSIPIVFPPVKINGTNFVDGGVLRNLPAWAIRDYCNVLYGSNCSPMQKNFKKKGTLLDIAYRSFHLMMKSNTVQDIRLCDHVIEISSLSSVGVFDLASLQKGVRSGYDVACYELEKILK